jgi:hypothetical protein
MLLPLYQYLVAADIVDFVHCILMDCEDLPLGTHWPPSLREVRRAWNQNQWPEVLKKVEYLKITPGSANPSEKYLAPDFERGVLFIYQGSCRVVNLDWRGAIQAYDSARLSFRSGMPNSDELVAVAMLGSALAYIQCVDYKKAEQLCDDGLALLGIPSTPTCARLKKRLEELRGEARERSKAHIIG